MAIKSNTKKSNNLRSTKIKKANPAADPVVSSTVKISDKKPGRGFGLQILLVVLVGAAIFLVAQRYRSVVVAAFVNKTPITTLELHQVLSRRYGKAVLEELINSRLVREEAITNGITVGKDEIASEITKLEEKFGGTENLSTALLQYGLSRSDLDDQIELRLLQQKLADKFFKVEIADADVQKYYDSNKAIYADAKFDDIKEEIKSNLKDQKLQEEFTKWFDEVKQKAKISIFID